MKHCMEFPGLSLLLHGLFRSNLQDLSAESSVAYNGNKMLSAGQCVSPEIWCQFWELSICRCVYIYQLTERLSAVLCTAILAETQFRFNTYLLTYLLHGAESFLRS